MKITKLEIKCPFCNKVFAGNMVERLESSEGCDSCGYGDEPKGTIDIRCSNCKKLVYRKELK